MNTYFMKHRAVLQTKKRLTGVNTAKRSFTLIELLVVTSQLCRDFFKRFICTETYGECRSQKYTASYGEAVLHSIGVYAD